MDRRGFLSSTLALGCAPAIVRASSLMPVRALALSTTAQVLAAADGALMSWSQRSTAPGVVRSWKFAAGQDLAGYLNSDGNPQPAFDPQHGGLKFTVPGSGDANDAGWFEMNFTPGTKRAYGGGGPSEPATLPPDYYSQTFGLGDTYYVQWRQRFSQTLLENDYGNTTWKQVILGLGDRGGFRGHANSCTTGDLVLANYLDRGHRTRPDQRGFPILYQSCVDYAPLHESIRGDFRFQNQMQGCLYTGKNAGYPGCFYYFPDEWMIFQIGIHFGNEWWVDKAKPRPTSGWVKLWMGREGGPQILVHHRQNYGFRNLVPEQRHGKAWFLPYMTSRDRNIKVPEAYTWYDEIIVSRDFISGPLLGPPASAPMPTRAG